MTIRGMSAEKALQIRKNYDTPAALIKAFENTSSKDEGEILLSNICAQYGKRKIGPQLSEKVYFLFR